jgi:hypothetical protein
VLTGAGCADNSDELSKELGQAQAEIRDLRGSSLATQDRIEALERELGALTQARKADQARTETDRPSLPVVRLSPPSDDGAPGETAPAVAAPEATAAPSLEPRPVLRGDRFGTTLDATSGATHGGAPGLAGPRRPPSKGAGARANAPPATGPGTTNGAQ